MRMQLTMVVLMSGFAAFHAQEDVWKASSNTATAQ
jgi:hypothetical protein